MATAALLCGASTACGQKGPPLPPLRRVPAAVADFAVDRRDDRITLRFTVPATNFDGSTPAVIERIEIYAMTAPAGASTPTRLQLLDSKNLLTTVQVRPADADKPQAAPPDTRPAPGSPASVIDPVNLEQAGVGATRYYAAVGLAGRRRGAESAVVPLALAQLPDPPAKLAIDYDEKSMKITWPAGTAGQAFRVYEVAGAGATPISAKLLTDAPLKTAEFTTGVEFGRERCFVVRTVNVSGRSSAEGPPGTPECKTPVDQFRPEAPTKLAAVAAEGGIDLMWTGVAASDLAGYVILRGESASAILQRLTPSPVAETKYRDTTVRSGVTYVYSILAVDKAGNLSEQSNRQEVTAR